MVIPVRKNYAGYLEDGERNICTNRFVPWFETTILSAAVPHLVKDKSDKLIYIGESSDFGDRMATHSGRTYSSSLRRRIGTEILNSI
jgi:hypothetical protein